MALRQAKFGRIAVVTIGDDNSESVGDALATVGAGVVAGQRQPRGFPLSLPLHGTMSEDNPYDVGPRLRRQLRSLMENAGARLQAIYFRFDPDSELNGWVLVGAADITPANGGVTMGEWLMKFNDIYRVAKLQTHRPARRVELYDRRLSTTPRDVLGTIFGTDFAALTPLALSAIPVGASDLTGAAGRVLTPGTRRTLGGNVNIVPAAAHAEVISYEQAESDQHKADDVVVYDRRGTSAAPPLGYAAQTLLDSPRALHRLNETPGSVIAVDSSKNALNASVFGSPTWGVPGAIAETGATAGAFDHDAYIEVPAGAASAGQLNFLSDFSVDGYIRIPSGQVTLVPNGGFETDILGWLTSSGTLPISRSTAWAASGAASMRIQGTPAPSTSIAIRPMNASSYAQDGFPCVGGQQYTVRAVFNVTTLGTSTTTLRLYFHDSAGTIVGTNATSAAAVPGVQTMTGTSTAPANAVYCTVQIYTVTTAAPTAMDFSVDQIQVVRGAVAGSFPDLVPAYAVLRSNRRAGDTFGSQVFYSAETDQLHMRFGGGPPVVATSTPLGLARDTWMHVGATYEAAAGRVTFYRNGAMLSQATGLPTAIASSTRSLVRGRLEAD